MPRLALLILLPLLLHTAPARAFVLSEDELEERSTELGLTVRSFSFVLTGPMLREPYNPAGDADPTGIGLLDLRAFFAHKRPWLKLVLHNQLTSTVRSHASSTLLGLGRGLEPPRWLPLQATIADEQGLTLRETVDWAYAAVTLGPVTVTAGRQPITLGRGKLYKPLDLVATFALTEVDTEYKPGADAFRLDWNATQRTVLSLFATAGEWNDELALRGSAFALRAKQELARGEVGMLGGLVRGDGVIGTDAVVDAGKFDIYAELVLHLITDRSLTPRKPTTSSAVLRGLLGATFKPTAKLTLSPELYYNGFGEWRAEDYLGVALSERVAVGEMYNLGRAYVAGLALWEAHPLLNLNLALILNPVDPSALLSLGLSYSLAQNMVLLAGGYIPAGRVPDLRAGTPRTEFGLYPTFLFLELKAAM
jgi:hypothetical protein